MVRVSVTVTSGLLLISQLAEGPAPYRSPLGPVAYWAAGPRARASAAAGGVPSPRPTLTFTASRNRDPVPWKCPRVVVGGHKKYTR